jgi:hypothetical protein
MDKRMEIDENNTLNEMDCTFYFIVKSDDKTIVPKERMQKAICKKMEEIMDVRFYGMRSGPDVRSSLVLKKEWEGTIPEQIDFIYIDRENEEMTLLSQPQRDFVFEKVMESDADIDTLEIIETVLNELE